MLRRNTSLKENQTSESAGKDPFLIQYQIKRTPWAQSLPPVCKCFINLFKRVNENRVPIKFDIEKDVEKKPKINTVLNKFMIWKGNIHYIIVHYVLYMYVHVICIVYFIYTYMYAFKDD